MAVHEGTILDEEGSGSDLELDELEGEEMSSINPAMHRAVDVRSHVPLLKDGRTWEIIL